MAIENYKDHPSIKVINENVSFESRLSFAYVSVTDIEKEISNLNSNKAGTFLNIPTKLLNESSEIFDIVLKSIWNYEILVTQYLFKKTC